MTISLSVFACFTKKDYTKILNGLWYVLIGVIIGFIIMMILFSSEWIVLIFCAVILIIMGLYVIYDTQLILGGGHYEIGFEDYVLGCLMLYTDIIMIFYYLLRILGILGK